MGQLISETIDDLLFAAKGSPLGKPTAIVLTREGRKELTEELADEDYDPDYGTRVRSYAGIPIIVEKDAVGVSLRYS